MKIVREHINEKFTEDLSDPINDMGIGGFSFDQLKPGAVLKAKSNISINKGNSGYLTYWNKGINVSEGNRIIVISARKYILEGYREIKVFVPSDQTDDAIKSARDNLKTNPNYSRWGSKTRLIITKAQFNNKFIVVERGFDT
jgi:hypothetical protein